MLTLKQDFEFQTSKNEIKLSELQDLLGYQLQNKETNANLNFEKSVYVNENNGNSVKKDNKFSNQVISTDRQSVSVINKDADYFKNQNSNESKKVKNTTKHTKVKSESDNSQSENISNLGVNFLSQDVLQADEMLSQGFKFSNIDKKNSEINEKTLVIKKEFSKISEPDDQAKCKICKKPQAGKIVHKKCYYEYCSNMFCQDCHLKNHYQIRATNYNCLYFGCEFCGNKKLCIMSTIFCNACDKRSCSDCYRTQHSEHGNNIKIYNEN